MKESRLEIVGILVAWDARKLKVAPSKITHSRKILFFLEKKLSFVFEIIVKKIAIIVNDTLKKSSVRVNYEQAKRGGKIRLIQQYFCML